MSTAPRFDFGRLDWLGTARAPKRSRLRPPELPEVTEAREQYAETRQALDAARLVYQQARKRNREAKDRLARVRAETARAQRGIHGSMG
jgi:hypothetical protein